jgi:DNA-binding NarL/FixJ family response regulator
VIRDQSTPEVRTHSCATKRPILACGGPVRNAVPSAIGVALARREVLCLLPGGDDLKWLRGAAGKTRVVVSRTMPDIEYEVRDFMDRGGDVRVGGRVGTRLVVVDREIAFLPGSSPADSDTVIRTPATVERLVAVFDTHWDSARAPVAGRLLNDLQYAVITLLASGMTDEAVARKLDISPRTVQRHVRRIMELFGVRSRFELGIHITRRGVL